MKKLLLTLLLLIFLPLMPFSDATLDLSNKQLISNDGSIILEFGENTVKTFFTNSKITPNLELGIIKLSEQKFLFDSTDLVSVRILGDSIAVKSFEPSVILYARNTGNNDYSITLYTLDVGFKKQTFTASLESKTTESKTTESKTTESKTTESKTTESKTTESKTTELETKLIEETEVKQEVAVAISNPFSTRISDVYTLTIRVYDQTINPKADIQKQEGYLEGIEVNIEILAPDGNVYKTISGETDNKGYFIFAHKLTANIDKVGTYTLTIKVNNQIYEGFTHFLKRR